MPRSNLNSRALKIDYLYRVLPLEDDASRPPLCQHGAEALPKVAERSRPKGGPLQVDVHKLHHRDGQTINTSPRGRGTPGDRRLSDPLDTFTFGPTGPHPLGMMMKTTHLGTLSLLRVRKTRRRCQLTFRSIHLSSCACTHRVPQRWCTGRSPRSRAAEDD